MERVHRPSIYFPPRGGGKKKLVGANEWYVCMYVGRKGGGILS